MMLTVEENLRAIVADILDLDSSAISLDLSRQTAETWDSLSHLRLITAVEEEFGISLTMEEIESTDSLVRLLELVEARSGAR